MRWSRPSWANASRRCRLAGFRRLRGRAREGLRWWLGLRRCIRLPSSSRAASPASLGPRELPALNPPVLHERADLGRTARLAHVERWLFRQVADVQPRGLEAQLAVLSLRRKPHEERRKRLLGE